MAATFASLSPFLRQWRPTRPRLIPIYSQAGDSSSPSQNERPDPPLPPNNTALDKKALEVKRALEKAALYRKTNRTSPTDSTIPANPTNPTSPTSSAKPTNPMNPTIPANPVNRSSSEAAESGTENLGNFEAEIVTRDGVIKRNASKPADETSGSKTTLGPLRRQGVSSVDFLGLDFAEKKGRAIPAGLRAGFEPPPPGFLPAVEIITAGGSSSSSSSSSVKSEEEEKLYKPKVTTWGVFPRPDNISKMFGGGRTIRPGEQLETEEEKQMREARSRKLLEDYKKKMGLNVDPKVKAECQQALNQAQSLVDSGSLQGAVVLFEKVMEQMPFQRSLLSYAHNYIQTFLDLFPNVAKICKKKRTEEARAMYEKLVSHSNASVRRKAKQLLFGFQAMKSLKFSASVEWDALTYRSYFESFADGYDTGFKTNEEEKDELNPLGEVWVYAIFLTFPIFLVLALILLKGR